MPTAIAIIVLLSISPAAADDVPVFGRPSAHFYDAIGDQIRVEMSAVPTSLRVEQELTLTVRIVGAKNPGQIRRPDLRTLGDFAERFHLDDLDDGPTSGDCIFRYKLRPKNEMVKDIPPLLFRYWQPRLQYFAATSPEDAIPLTVRPRESSEVSAMPIQAPEFLFQIAEGEDAFAGPPQTLPEWLPALVLFVPLLVCLMWYVFWWRAHPVAAKMAQLRRIRAVRGALDGLLHAHRKSADAGQVARLMREYLRERWLMAANAITPTEIAAALELALPPALIELIESFFRACDAEQFGPSVPSAGTLAIDAEKLIQTLEQHARDTEISPHAKPSGSLVASLALALLLSQLEPAFADEQVRPHVAWASKSFRAGVAARGDEREARRHFSESAAWYSSVRKTHCCTNLYRNEGNARVLAGDYGGAIAVFRLGLRDARNDVGMRRGLEYARSQVQFSDPADRVRFTPPGERFIGAASFLRHWVVVAIGVLATAGWVGLTRWLMLRNRFHLLIGLVALSFAISLTVTRLVAEQYRASESLDRIAVTTKSVILRKGDGPSFLPRLDAPLPAGVETIVRLDRGDWIQVELADTTLGWLPRESVLIPK